MDFTDLTDEKKIFKKPNALRRLETYTCEVFFWRPEQGRSCDVAQCMLGDYVNHVTCTKEREIERNIG